MVYIGFIHIRLYLILNRLGANVFNVPAKLWDTLFESRLYDSAIGRFMQVDPHTETYKNINVFTVMFNNPIHVIDPNGLAERCYHL
jgi:RHS repeat-associated protein